MMENDYWKLSTTKNDKKMAIGNFPKTDCETHNVSQPAISLQV